MSREIKRVPLDFEWPLNTVWKGYRPMPANLSCPCPACEGSGYSPAAKRLKDLWYGYVPFSPTDNGSRALTPETPAVWAFAQRNVTRSPEFYGTGETAIRREALRLCDLWNGRWSYHLNAADVAALIDAGRLYDLTQDWAPGKGWTLKDPMPEITPEMVNTWSIGGMGHDAINAGVCIEAACQRAGHAATCETCEGEGDLWPSQELKAAHEAWEPTEPPAGDAYQLWETVSDGSPISPPFATPEALARWLATKKQGCFDPSEPGLRRREVLR